MPLLVECAWMREEATPEQKSLTTAIIDFVITESPCDIDMLRRALYCQVFIFDDLFIRFREIYCLRRVQNFVFAENYKQRLLPRLFQNSEPFKRVDFNCK